MIPLLFLCLLAADILAHEQAGHKGGKAAGNFFGVEFLQQRPVRDVCRDDGGQMRTEAVVQQTVQGAEEETGVEFRAQIIEDEQVCPGCRLQQSLFLPGGVRAEVQRFQFGKKSGLET